jgi:signal peptidase I
MSTQATAHTTKESVKDTVVSLIIAFIFAFTARSFVCEAFIIPTGSMAPTLLGAHMRFTNARTGNDWPVVPAYYTDESRQFAEPLQGNRALGRPPISVRDPITGEAFSRADVPSRAGDRILVLKYLYLLEEPSRFDVVVFKFPSNPSQNFIKRLVGLPGEQIALVDGDVFVRPANADGSPAAWDAPGWTIARKPDRVQNTIWQRVYDSSMEPAESGSAAGVGGSPFVPPMIAGPGVTRVTGAAAAGGGAYDVNTEAGQTGVIAWNNAALWLSPPMLGNVPRAVSDFYPYNDNGVLRTRLFPVSDVRIGAGVTLRDGAIKGGQSVGARLVARQHEFVGEIVGGASGPEARLRMRPVTPGNDAPWKDIASESVRLPSSGRFSLEVWHVDQQLEVRVDSRIVARGAYEWSPMERIRFATGRELSAILSEASSSNDNPLAFEGLYTPATIEWVSSAPARLSHLTLDRDLHYQPARFEARSSTGIVAAGPAFATHPDAPIVLGEDQFFTLGDNSPQSQDGRLWPAPDPWVGALMNDRGMSEHRGVVPRDLMLGRAFFVYFPSFTGGNPVSVPDFGRMRFIQ